MLPSVGVSGYGSLEIQPRLSAAGLEAPQEQSYWGFPAAVCFLTPPVKS